MPVEDTTGNIELSKFISNAHSCARCAHRIIVVISRDDRILRSVVSCVSFLAAAIDAAACDVWVSFDRSLVSIAVYFRALRISTNGTLLESKYYNTFAYTASGGIPAKGQSSTSVTARRFYSAVAAQQDYWDATMKREGAMGLNLPSAVGTDGPFLVNQSLHSIARDMISRIGAANGTGHGFFPQYGVSGVYAKAANHGFEDTFQASFVMALEWGCFEQVHKQMLLFVCGPSSIIS